MRARLCHYRGIRRGQEEQRRLWACPRRRKRGIRHPSQGPRSRFQVQAQVGATAGHDHLTEVACVDVPGGEKRPEFGCFNIATVTGLHFSQASVAIWLNPRRSS